MRLTTSQNALHFGMICSKLRRFLGLTTLPQTPKSVGDSCLQQSQLRAFSAYNFPDSHIYMRNTLKFRPAQSPPLWRLQRLDFFASNMSHYLKSLKICPDRKLHWFQHRQSNHVLTIIVLYCIV